MEKRFKTRKVHIPKELKVDCAITESGLSLNVSGDKFQINYPDHVWATYPRTLKEVFRDTISHASTFYLPQMLSLPEIKYSTARPITESFLYKSGIYDVTYCANVDKKSSREYLRKFFNTRYLFGSENIVTPEKIDFSPRKQKKRKAVVLFSFGKEGLLVYSICRELGIEPVLVTIRQTGHEFEHAHKLKLIKNFEKEFNTKVHVIDYQPGVLKEGRWWRRPTELGWGLHVIEYALLSLPFAYSFNADYLLCGNEQSCNDIYIDNEGVLVYRAGIDQHREWTHQQSILQSMMLGRRIEALSFVEPLYEIAETKILHTRYKEIGKYQMSCMASEIGAKEARWCHSCEKCAYMFMLFRAWGLDPYAIGYRHDMLDKAHAYLYDGFFTRTARSHLYGSQGELGLSFYMAYHRGVTGYTMDRFKKTLLARFGKKAKEYSKHYLGVHDTINIARDLKPRVLKIFHQELDKYAKNPLVEIK